MPRVPAVYFGASVAGPGHRATGRGNEDRWIGRAGAFGTAITVSDGVGSVSAAGIGALAACRVALASIREWHRAGSHEAADLTARIEPHWRDAIAPHGAADCSATCLLAVVRPDQTLHVAGLGDGIAVVLHADSTLEWVVGPRDGGFASNTDALGGGAPWKSRSLAWQAGDVVVLATDGVADDLLEDRVGDFARWLVDGFVALPPRLRSRALARELRNWPTPRHIDDKTVAVLAAGREALA